MLSQITSFTIIMILGITFTNAIDSSSLTPSPSPSPSPASDAGAVAADPGGKPITPSPLPSSSAKYAGTVAMLVPGKDGKKPDDPDKQYAGYQLVSDYGCWDYKDVEKLVFKTGFTKTFIDGKVDAISIDWVKSVNNITWYREDGSEIGFDKKYGCYLEWYDDQKDKNQYTTAAPPGDNGEIYPVDYCIVKKAPHGAKTMSLMASHPGTLGDLWNESKWSYNVTYGCDESLAKKLDKTTTTDFEDTVMFLEKDHPTLPIAKANPPPLPTTVENESAISSPAPSGSPTPA